MASHRDNQPVRYARVGNKIVPAKWFVGVPPEERPIVLSLETGLPLSIKAGPQLTPHMARRGKGSGRSNPETARHINSKGHFLEVAQGLRVLDVEVRCAGAPDINGRSRHCHEPFHVLAACDWDAVEIQIELDRRVPDAQIVRNARPILLVEFVATNPVGWEKERDLAVLDAPTIVVDADPRFFDGSTAWRGDKPLAVRHIIPDAFAPRCWEHEVAYRAYCESVFGIAGLPLYRTVDVFPPHGEPRRSVFRVDAFPEGADGDVRWTMRQDGKLGPSFRVPSWRSVRWSIDSAFDSALDIIQRKFWAPVVTQADWVPYRALNVFSPALLYDKPLRPPRRWRQRRGRR
jgi:hypothetical protein